MPFFEYEQITLTGNNKKWKSLAILFLGGMVLVNILVIWYGRNFISEGYGDFSAFYTAGKLIERGQGSKLYDQNAQWEVQQEFASKVTIRHKPLPFIRPAFEAIIFAPFAKFQYPISCALWMALNVLALLLFVFLIRVAEVSTTSVFAGILVCFSYVPVAIALLQGQDAIFLLIIFTLFFFRLKMRKDFQAGFWLSLGLIKFHLTIPIVVVLAIKRKTRLVFGFLLGALILLLVSAGIIGWQGVTTYPKYIWHLSQVHNAGVVSTQSMPNIRGLLATWQFTSQFAYANSLFAALEAFGIFFASYIWNPKDNSDEVLKLGIAIILIITILSGYYAYSYDLTVLLLPYFLLTEIFWKKEELSGWPRTLFFLSLGLICSPLQWLLFFGFGYFYLLVPVLFMLLIVCVKALKVLRADIGVPLEIAVH